jgi:(p)ppGpp synthase/HD superfamily hydrolase
MIKKSKDFALRCHSSTNHFYDRTLPYSHHLQMVVDVALKFIHLIPIEFHGLVISACWLHDTIEDTRITYSDLCKEINIDVAEIVYALTNEKGRTRRERANEKYYEGIRNTRFATFCKLCDRIANIEYSISKGSDALSMYSKENPHFIRSIYNEEYDEMFDYLKEIVS